MFPYISEELLNELEERFPNQSPHLNETHQDLMWRGGQRSVVEFLRGQFEERTSRQLSIGQSD
jgi:hypothetical protein